MEEMLIEKVQSRVFLYDVESPDYRNYEMRINAWEEIGKELKIKPENAKDIWERLRRCFMNALNRRRNKKSGDGAKRIPSWKYEQKMSFLLPSLDNGNTRNNFLTGEVQNELLEGTIDDSGTSRSIYDNTVDDTNIFNGEFLSNENFPQTQKRYENESFNISSETDINSLSVRNKKRKREEGDNSIIQMMKILKKNSAIRQIRCDGRKLSRYLDETDMFFLSLAKTTKTLPPLEQAKVKLQVSQAVLQAQIAISSVSPPSHVSTHNEASPHIAASAAPFFSRNGELTINFGNDNFHKFTLCAKDTKQ